MVLAPGDKEGGADNRHRGADQWLYVLSGSGEAIVGRRRHKLRAGSLFLIERKEKHRMPPAYRKDGNPRSRGKK